MNDIDSDAVAESQQIAPQVGPSRLSRGLTLVATPIGSARDITLRALDALRDADAIICEDTRNARHLMQIHGVPVNGRPMIAYHDQNGEAARPRVMRLLEDGKRVVYVSDAGTPLIADPGYRLAQEAIAAGHEVTTAPGACAAIAALCVSGLPSDRFLFAGFTPHKSSGRKTMFAGLAGVDATLIFYESPRRLAASLAEMAEAFGPRPAVVARELTKAFEEARRAPLADLAAHYAEAGAPKGEVVVLIGPPEAQKASEADIVDLLRGAMADMSVKDAAAHVAAMTGAPKREIYARALAFKAEQ